MVVCLAREALVVMEFARRQWYMDYTGLTEDGIRQAVGGYTVNVEAAKEKGFTDKEIGDISSAIQAVSDLCFVISMFYNKVEMETGADPRQTVPADDQAGDQATLLNSFTEDFRLTDPVGNAGGRDKTVDAIMSAKLVKSSFDTVDERLNIQNPSLAIAVGSFDMTAQQLAQNIHTGEIAWKPRVGVFSTTHTWVRGIDGQWRVAASQLTQQSGPPPDPDWVFLDD
jgi:hypothetical protein